MPPKEQTTNLFVDLGIWHSSAAQKALNYFTLWIT